jgi:NitT/TauT family transport system substrate-binding protein
MARRTRRVRGLTALATAILALVAAGCGANGGGAAGGAQEGPLKTLTIACQPGIGYAPLLIIKEQGTLEKALPGTKVVWKQLDSGAAIRDGMLSGDIQVGSGGLGPFMVGWAKGIDWKVVSAMEDMDLWLMAKNPKYQSLEDFKSGGKIAMPAPDSIQAVVLAKLSQERLGDPNALEKNIVALGHPDGLQALLSGQLAGHLTSPPFEFVEQARGARKIATSYQAFGGPHTFNSIFVRQGFHDSQKKAVDVLYQQVEDAVKMLQDQPAKAAQLLSKESGGATSAKDFQDYITHQGVAYTTTPHGFKKIADFMKAIGLIDKAPGSFQEVTFDNLHGSGGS